MQPCRWKIRSLKVIAWMMVEACLIFSAGYACTMNHFVRSASPRADYAMLSSRLIAGEDVFRLSFDAGSRLADMGSPVPVSYTPLQKQGMTGGASAARDLMSLRMRRSILRAAIVLSRQDANVVFERDMRSGRWLFRRGPIDLEIDGDVCVRMGEVLQAQGLSRILLASRRHSVRAFERSLVRALSGVGDVTAGFTEYGIAATDKVKRVLLVAPFGDINGDALKYSVPHKGVELIVQQLIRSTDDIDALAYNPNLGSREGLYAFVRDNTFDVIGVSVLQTVLKANLEILGRLALLSPDSLFVSGGNELKFFPLEAVARSWPVDVLSFDSGASLLTIAELYRKDLSKEENISALTAVANIAVRKKNAFESTRREKDHHLMPSGDLDSEVPYDKPDLTHGGRYDAVQHEQKVPIAFDRIGRKPTRVPLGDYCKGRCIFCGTTRGTRKDLSPNRVIELIAHADPSDDSVHFESADFLYDPGAAVRLADELARVQRIKKIPKLAIARVDEVGNGTVIKRMAQGGFKIIAFGIESFDDRVLRGIGKNTTAADNKRALDFAIAAGIKPGLNLILFTPWDTVETTLHTIDHSLRYMKQGAYINVVPYLFAGFGRKISRMSDILEYETYDFPGLRAPFRFPRRSKIFDARLAAMRDKVYIRAGRIEETSGYPEWAKRSVSIHSLFIFQAFVETLKEEGTVQADVLEDYLRRIEAAILLIVRAEQSTLYDKEDPAAAGVTQTHFNPFNQLLTSVIINTEDGRTVTLRLTDNYSFIPEGDSFPQSLIYDMYVQTISEGETFDEYRGWLEMRAEDHRNVDSYRIMFRRMREADVFIYRVIAEFAEAVQADGSLLIDRAADFRKTGPGIVSHHHRLPEEPLFGNVSVPEVTPLLEKHGMIKISQDVLQSAI